MQEDEEALIPQYDDATDLQRRLHKKMHSYQMFRALSKGFMPSNEQLIVNLRTLLASDILNPDNPDLSDSGRNLVRYSKQFLKQFIELLLHKNDRDQIQDFIWFMTKARVSLDTENIQSHAKVSRTKADATAAYESLRTVGSLLLTNSDFRLFLGDLNTIGRQVFADTAFSLSNVAGETAKAVEPSEPDAKTLTGPGADQAPPPSAKELGNPISDVTKTVGDGLAKTGQDAISSLKENLSGDQKDTVLDRLKQAVLKLRKRNDYSDSVSTIGVLIKRYAMAYSRAADSTIGAVQTDFQTNDELDRAVKNFWALLSSFGDKEHWKSLEERFNQVMSHSQKDPEFEHLMMDVGNSLQKMFTDPSFFDSAGEKVEELKEKSQSIGAESSLRQDIDSLLAQARITFRSTLEDTDVASLIATSSKLISIVSPTDSRTNQELLTDSLHIFIPLLISLIQHVPIPRLEVSVPEVDLLLENLIIEPGVTVNNSSFLPYRLHMTSTSDLVIRKARFRTATEASTIVTIRLDGLSVRAEELGFWMRAHSGLLRLADEGIASVEMDERGLDIHLDVEIGKDKLEKVLSLKDVRVKVHHLNYNLRKSKFSFISWLLKPFLRPILRRTIESQLASAISDLIHAANRELVFARERLRATRISDPQDLRTFIKAVMARLTPEDDPDMYTAVGVRPSKGVFKGVYAPGSLVKLWEEEAVRAVERIEDEGQLKGWRNEIFDVQVAGSGMFG